VKLKQHANPILQTGENDKEG